MNFWDDITEQNVKNANDGGFLEFQIGDNEAYVKQVEERYSQSGNPMLVITFANSEGAEIKHYIVAGEYKLSKMKNIYTSLGIPFGNSEIEEWVKKRCIVVCKKGKPNNNGNTYNAVSYLKPMPGATTNTQPAQQRQFGQQTAQQGQAQSDDGFYDDIPF